MGRKIVVSLFVVLVFCVVSIFSATAQAQNEQKKPMMGQMQEKSEKAMNAGNKLCPVSGLAVNSQGTPTQYEYKGKIYNFCCKSCIESFKKDPEKYMKIVDQELKKNGMMNKDDNMMKMDKKGDMKPMDMKK